MNGILKNFINFNPTGTATPAIPATEQEENSRNSNNSSLPVGEIKQKRRISESLETEWLKAIHPLDLESQGKQKIHWVTAHCPELDIPTTELEQWYRDDLKDIARMPLEHVYRIIRDYVNLQSFYSRGKEKCM